MRLISLALAAILVAIPIASAHGALELNKFDTYALSDFEGQEDSFPWEGFEIWDIFVGDGYSMSQESHGVYFKGNFAGDGTIRPTGSQLWTLQFNFDVGGNSYERTVSHDGIDVTTDFEELEFQLADGNVFQIHAWVPIAEWGGMAVSNLVVLSSVDGSPRDIAPGGIFDPVTGQEIPVAAPATPVFPELGEGRIVEIVPLTGSAKFLDVTVAQSKNTFTFNVNNTMATQGQHFMTRVAAGSEWNVTGTPDVQTIEGGAGITFTLGLTHVEEGMIAPLRIDLMSDVGALQSWYAYADGAGIHFVEDESMAASYSVAAAEEAPALPMLLLVGALLLVGRRNKQ